LAKQQLVEAVAQQPTTDLVLVAVLVEAAVVEVDQERQEQPDKDMLEETLRVVQTGQVVEAVPEA
jgi:hypothetical protein